MLKKVIFYILLSITLLTGPWWLFGILFLFGFFGQEDPWYIGLGFGFIADMVTTGGSTQNSMIFSIVGCCLFFVLIFIKDKIRIPNML